MTIDKILAIDIKKVTDTSLLDILDDFIKDYKKANNKQKFITDSKEQIKDIYVLVTQLSPAALPKEKQAKEETSKTSLKEAKTSEKDSKDPEKTATSKKENDKQPTGKSSSKSTQKQSTPKKKDPNFFKEFEEDIKICRAKIKELNQMKRAGKPEKEKPKRHEKIKSHLISILNLIPEQLKKNTNILEQAEKILLKTNRDILKVYSMDELKIKENQSLIKEKVNKLEEKAGTNNE